MRIDRSTLAHWVGFAAYELAPLHDRLIAIEKASTKLFADETRCPMLDPGRRKTKPAIYGPSLAMIAPGVAPTRRPSPTPTHPDAAPSMPRRCSPGSPAPCRSTAPPDTTDKRGGPLVLAYCWSHFRRRFYDIAKTGNAPIASEALARIGQLYAIEAESVAAPQLSAGPSGRPAHALSLRNCTSGSTTN